MGFSMGVGIMRGLHLIATFGFAGWLAVAPAVAAKPAPPQTQTQTQTRPPGAKACIDNQSIDGHQAEDENTLIFTVGRQSYRNHLRTRCPGLMRLNSFGGLETETQGSQLCEGDTIRVFDTQGVRAVGLGAYPRCALGWFEPIPPSTRMPEPVKPPKR